MHHSLLLFRSCKSIKFNFKFASIIFLSLHFLGSCNKDSGGSDPCNIAGEWTLIDPSSPEPIIIAAATMELNKNGDMIFNGLNTHNWKISDDCTTFTFWPNDNDQSMAIMQIHKLTANELEMELVGGTISLFDPIALLLGIDIAKFKR